MQQADYPRAFKFRYVQKGQTVGFGSQKGVAEDRELILGKETLVYDDLMSATARDNRLLLVLAPQARLSDLLAKRSMERAAIALETDKVKAQLLAKHINRICSLREVEKTRQRLAEAGKSDLFRTTTCPDCESTIDLSELDRSSHVYCRYCETVFQEGGEAVTRGALYRVCEGCGMFDRIRPYTEFYFYFLLVVYGFSYSTRHVCDNCAHRIFLKTFFCNLIFLLGLPSSIYVKIRSLSGRDPYWKELARANALSRKGRYQEADVLFSQLQMRYADHPGLLMNEGIGHLCGNDGNGAVACFQRTLRSCPNYLPVLRLMHQLQEAAGQHRQGGERAHSVR
jgi:hypothetical protein